MTAALIAQLEALIDKLRKTLLNEGVMEQWDNIRRHVKSNDGSLPRDMFEGMLECFDEERTEAATAIRTLLDALRTAERERDEARATLVRAWNSFGSPPFSGVFDVDDLEYLASVADGDLDEQIKAVEQALRTATARAEALERERDEARSVANNGALSADAVRIIRQMLTEQGVPVAAFIDDHVANAIVQRNQERARAEAAERENERLTEALKFYRDEWLTNCDGDVGGEPHLVRSWQEPTDALWDDAGRKAHDAIDEARRARQALEAK